MVPTALYEQWEPIYTTDEVITCVLDLLDKADKLDFGLEMTKCMNAFIGVMSTLEFAGIEDDVKIRPLVYFETLLSYVGGRVKYAMESLNIFSENAALFGVYMTVSAAKRLSCCLRLPAGFNQASLLKQISTAYHASQVIATTPDEIVRNHPPTPVARASSPVVASITISPAPRVVPEYFFSQGSVSAKSESVINEENKFFEKTVSARTEDNKKQLYLPTFIHKEGAIDMKTKLNELKVVSRLKIPDDKPFEGSREERSFRAFLMKIKELCEDNCLSIDGYSMLLDRALGDQLRKLVPKAQNPTYESLLKFTENRLMKLFDIYAMPIESERLLANRNFSNLRQYEAPLTEYCHSFDKLITLLEELKSALTDGDKIIKFISGLNLKYQDRANLLLIKENITYNELRRHLLHAYKLESLGRGDPPKAPFPSKNSFSGGPSKPPALAPLKQTFGAPRLDTPKKPCYICNDHNHFSSNCSIPFDQRKCTNCHKFGHIAKACQNQVQSKEAFVTDVEILTIEICESLNIESTHDPELSEEATISCRIAGSDLIKVLLDTGAACAMIDKSVLDMIDPNNLYEKSEDISYRVKYADGRSSMTSTTVTLPISYQRSTNNEWTTTFGNFIVLDKLTRGVLFGRAIMREIGMRLTFGIAPESRSIDLAVDVAQSTSSQEELDALSAEVDEFTIEDDYHSLMTSITQGPVFRNSDLEKTISKAFDRNPYQNDSCKEPEDITDDNIEECAKHFLGTVQGLGAIEFASGYHVTLLEVDDEPDVIGQKFMFQIKWKIDGEDFKKPWDSSRAINALSGHYAAKWQEHIGEFQGRSWWKPYNGPSTLAATIFPVLQSADKTTEVRACCDAKGVNAHSPKVSSKTHTVPQCVLLLRSLLSPSSVLFQMDLSKAFYRIRIRIERESDAEEHILSMTIGRQKYSSSRLVFGLSVGPMALTSTQHVVGLITRAIIYALCPADFVPCYEIVVMDDFLFIGQQLPVSLSARIYSVVWKLCGFDAPIHKTSSWSPITPVRWLGPSWLWDQNTCKLSMVRKTLDLHIPKKWTKRSVFAIAGQFVAITNSFHEALARVHADGMRRISGKWPTWDHECEDRSLIAILKKHMARALDNWNLCCTTEDISIPLLTDVTEAIIETDASQKGYGFVVRSNDITLYAEGRLFPHAAYAWHANRREFHGLSQAIARMDGLLHYLPHIKVVTALTDSKVTVAHADLFKDVSSKALERKVILRMRNAIREYSYLWKEANIKFNIKHVPGLQNIRADELSRTAYFDTTVEFIEIESRTSSLHALDLFRDWIRQRECFLSWKQGHWMPQALHETDLLRQFLLVYQSKDRRCAHIQATLEGATSRTSPEGEQMATEGENTVVPLIPLHSSEVRWMSVRNDGLLVRLFDGKTQIVIPDSLIIPILNHLHVQMGHASLLQVLQSFFDIAFHESARKVAKQTIHSCLTCQLGSGRKDGAEVYGTIHPPERPYQIIGIDLYGPLRRARGEKEVNTKRHVLTIVCRLTGYTRFILLQNAKSDAVCEAVETWLFETGANVRVLISDNGPQFVLSPKLAGLLLCWNIRHVTLPPYSPFVGGFYEIRHRTATKCLRALLVQFPLCSWPLLISIAQSKVNGYVGPGRSASPHQLIYGWRHESPTVGAFHNALNESPLSDDILADPVMSSVKTDAALRSTEREKFLDLWKEEFENRQRIQHSNFEPSRANLKYDIGSKVYFINDIIRKKFAPLSQGPFELVHQLGQNIWVMKSDDSAIPVKAHTRNLRLAVDPSQIEDNTIEEIEDPVEHVTTSIEEAPVSLDIPSGKVHARKRVDPENSFVAAIAGQISRYGRLRKGSLIE